jgi:CheY-like chemotaxis protein
MTVSLNKPFEMNDFPLKGRKILIVEDDFSGRIFLNKVLEQKGAVLFNAVTGLEAVTIVKENPDLDLVLMDIQIPVMDGYAAANEIRKFHPDLVIIAQTAYDRAGEYGQLSEAGFKDYITKPLIPDTLIRKIISHLP